MHLISSILMRFIIYVVTIFSFFYIKTTSPLFLFLFYNMSELISEKNTEKKLFHVLKKKKH